MPTATLCPCGQPLHYHDPRVRELVEKEIAHLGECVKIKLPAGIRERTFLVPRHFLALHGGTTEDLLRAAREYGFEEVGGVK